MAAYLVAEIEVKDPGWVPNYADKVHAIVHRHGGEYLSRSANVVPLEGEVMEGTILALLKFPGEAALRAFLDDPDYAPFASARRAGSRSRLLMIDGTDAAGTIPYLPKG